jgi:dienelactone hydrolase
VVGPGRTHQGRGGAVRLRGFTTLAPDFFHGATTGEPDEAMRLMMGLAMDQAAKDVAGAASYLSGLDS